MIRRFLLATAGSLLFGLPVNAVAQSTTLTGIITDSQRAPLQNAHVIAVPDKVRYWVPGDMAPLSTARSKPDGEFSLQVPTTAPVALIAWGPSHRMTKYQVNPETAKTVRIGMALEPGVTVKGRVYDRSANSPVVGARVGPLVAGLDTGTQRALRVVPQWTTTDDQGAFALSGVAADVAHQFLVQADGYVTANVELERGKTSVEVPLDKGGVSISGEVFAKGARPDAFADTIVRANGNGFDVLERADTAGRFAFKGLPGGTFSVEPILMDDQRAAAVEVVELPEDDGTSISLEVSSGYYIRGTAIDVETSAPANQVPVGLHDRWSTSSTNGAFALGPFYQPQQLSLMVPEEDGWQLQEVVAMNDYNATDGFSDVNNVVVRVRRQRLLKVSLANYEVTTQPVTVTVLSEDGNAIRREVTSATAEIPLFQAGQYAVFAVSGGLASGVEQVMVGEQDNLPVLLTFGPSTSAAGRVTLVNTDETTRVRTFNLAMHFAQANGKAGPQLYTGTNPLVDGSFVFHDMPNGKYVLMVSNGSQTRTTSHPLTLAVGLNTLPEIQWEAGNRISGKVVNPQGNPVPFAHVTLLQRGGDAIRQEADEAGEFKAEDLAASALEGLIVESAAFATYAEQDVALPADEKIIIMQPVGRLVIVVEAAPSSTWNVHVVRMSPWAVGAYAEQLVGQSIFTREVIGGEALETGIGESGQFRIVAISKASGDVMVSDLFNWAGEQAKGQSIYLRSTSKGTISGTVGDGDQAVEVTAINTAVPESASREQAEFRVTTTNGRYELAGLPAGNYLVLGAGAASSSYALNVNLEAGGNATANLEVVPTVELTGVVEFGGEAVPGAQVRLLSETDSGFKARVATTGADGGFLFEGLSPDSYSVSAEFQADDEEVKAATSVAVKAGEQPAAVRLDLTPPQPVLFQVDAGVTLPGDTPVHMMNLQSRQIITATWTSEGLEAQAAPGRYEVWSGDAVVGIAEVQEDGTGTVTSQ